MYITESITKYLNDLASKLPAPGGGSSAALSGAMACSLISMVLNFTIGKERYRGFEDRAKEMFKRSQELREDFTRFFEEDIKSYDQVAKAYKMPKETQPDTISRKKAIRAALEEALRVPLEICRRSAEAIKLLPELAKSANKGLICDVEVPLRLLEAAFYSAKINVVMNQKGIEDKGFNDGITKELSSLEAELLKHKEIARVEIDKVVNDK